MNLLELRQKYQNFTYQNFTYQIKNNDLIITFNFNIDNKFFFNPQTIIKSINLSTLDNKDGKILNNLIFHLGLIESISYYKAVCCQNIFINCGQLVSKQRNYYQNLLIKGLGEYFFINKIDFTSSDFIKIRNQTTKKEQLLKFNKRQTIFHQSFIKNNLKFGEKKPNSKKKAVGKYLLLLSGGKDSAITLNFFQKNKIPFTSLLVNPNETTLKINSILNSKQKNANKYKMLTFSNNYFSNFLDITNKDIPSSTIIVYRQIDPLLLDLNKKNFLNGHTPFSAYLAFLSSLIGFIFNIQNIVVSNENSSSEESAIYLNKKINHQFSKSFQFEKKFRNYSKNYLFKNLNFFSLLRPFYELKIAKKFSSLSKFHHTFKSCNVGQKNDIWCHECSKCLFVFTILFPFIKKEKITKNIFNQNLFNKKELLLFAYQLIGQKANKPFECVGTKLECQIAFYLSIKKYKNKPLPFILKKLKPFLWPKRKFLERQKKKILHHFNEKNFLPENIKKLIQQYFYD